METNIVTRTWRKVSWLTKLSVSCALVSSLLSLVSLFSPHWICAEEIDWPKTTLRDQGHEIFDKFKHLTEQIHHSYGMVHTEEDTAESFNEEKTLLGNVTFIAPKVKVNDTTSDLDLLTLTNSSIFTQERKESNLTGLLHVLMSSNTTSHVDKVSPLRHTSLDATNVSHPVTSSFVDQSAVTPEPHLYADAETINEEIELFLFNETSDTSKLVRYTVYCGLWSCCVKSACRTIYSGLDGWLVPVRVLHGFSTTCVLGSLLCCCLLACVTASSSNHGNALRATCCLLVSAELLLWTCVAVFLSHYLHQHMVLFEDRWLGWSFYILPLGGITLLPTLVVTLLRIVKYKQLGKTEYLLDTVTT